MLRFIQNNYKKILLIALIALFFIPQDVDINWKTVVTILLLGLVIFVWHNMRIPAEHQNGELGTCSVCGKIFYPNLKGIRKLFFKFFFPKEFTMVCPNCRKERAMCKKRFRKALRMGMKQGYLAREEETQLLSSLERCKLLQLIEDTSKDISFIHRMTGYKLGEFAAIPFTDVSLKEGEKLYFFVNTSLYQVRTRTHYEGQSSGMSFRIAKGVSYRIGEYRGKPIRQQYLNLEGNGTLYITNQRVIFNGVRNITYKWKDVIQVLSFPPDGISFSAENKVKFYLLKLHKKDPLIYRELLACCEGILGANIKN